MTSPQSSNQVLIKLSKLDDSYVTRILVKKMIAITDRHAEKIFS